MRLGVCTSNISNNVAKFRLAQLTKQDLVLNAATQANHKKHGEVWDRTKTNSTQKKVNGQKHGTCSCPC